MFSAGFETIVISNPHTRRQHRGLRCFEVESRETALAVSARTGTEKAWNGTPWGRDTANLLTVSGACLVVVASGAWLVSHLLTDTTVSLVSLEREMFNHRENLRSLTSGGQYPEKAHQEQDTKN